MNGTNIFLVKNGRLLTPTPDACLHGITRGLVIEIARENAIEVEERNISLTELYAADEAFGMDYLLLMGRILQNRAGSQMTRELIKLFAPKMEHF